MFINDFQSSNEHRLHQVLHTLKSVHGTELDLENSELSDLESMRESSEIIKNSIVNESRFNTYNSNPEYAKHMLIMEAVRLYLTEIAPKRLRRKVKESTGIEVDEDMINPAQDPNMQLNKKPGPGQQNKPASKPGMVKMKNKATGKIEDVSVGQVQSRQSRGDTVVGDSDVNETLDPALTDLMRKYGVEPGVEEGNEFTGALSAARNAGEKSFTVGDETFDVTNESDEEYHGDWGSSDWYPVMKGMDEYLSKNGTTPETIEAAAEQEAEFYHRMMGYSVEDAKDVIISRWMTRKGIKTAMEEAEDSVSKPNYHKLAKEHHKAAADSGDKKDLAKHKDLQNYYLIKAGQKPAEDVVNTKRFMSHVEKTYIDQLKEHINESQFDHDGYQASMARSELYRNTKYAMDMLKIVKAGEEIQPWVAANLTKAAEYLDKIYHYLDYYTKFEPEQLPEEAEPELEGHDDSNGSIARQNLMQIVEYSTKLFSMIQPGDKLEGWVAMKLTTASDCISSSKHYMEYQQFEKHAHDMLDDVHGMAEEGAKMKKKSVKESVGQMLMSMMLNEDQDLAQAQTLLAAKALSDNLQDMAEKVAKMSVEDLMPLVDTMKEQFGLEAAEGYNEMMKGSLEALLKSVTDSKDASDNAILQLQGGGVPSAAGNELPEPGVTPAADDVTADVGAEDAAADIEAPELPDEEPLGRSKKDESVRPRNKALNEKWDSEMKTKEKDKGMWDGWTVTELKAEKKKLMDKESRSAADQKKVKQLTFAIRAKQKDKWGKVSESKSDINEGAVGNVIKVLIALGLGAAALNSFSNKDIVDMPLARAMAVAAAKGDSNAAEELKKLDIYVEAGDWQTLEGLKDTYLNVPTSSNPAVKEVALDEMPGPRSMARSGRTWADQKKTQDVNKHGFVKTYKDTVGEPKKSDLRTDIETGTADYVRSGGKITKVPASKSKVKESKVEEKAPPGKKAEDFIKGAKADYKERYGDRWEEVLYRTAWKKFGPKSESYLRSEKMLESTLANKSKLEKAFETHKKQFKKMVNEGTLQDPLKTGYGLEGELMVEKIGDLNGMIAKLKEMLRAEISRGASQLLMAEHDAKKAERLAVRKAEAPYGVLWLGDTGVRQGKFFESDKLRKFWLDLNAKDLNEHQLVNPEHFDAEIKKLSARKD